MIILVTWLVVGIVVLYLYLRQAYSKFTKAGVNHLPVVPFFGHFFRPVFKIESTNETLVRIVSAFPDDKIVGLYEMMRPTYLVKDVETIKKVTIKDFEHFVDRRTFASDDDPIFGRNLLNLRGDEWKEMRSSLSPAFTSSKIRLMVPFMVEVGEAMNKVLHRRIKNSANGYIDVELKDLTTRYAHDVIASCAFGLKVDSQSTDNHFFIKSREVTNFKIYRILKVIIMRSFPKLGNMLNIKLSPEDTTDYYRHIILNTMKERENKNIIRHDMINILNEVKKGNLVHEKELDTDAGFATVEESAVGKKTYSKEWSDDDLVAQAVIFLIAGFDTVSTAMTFILHEMAVHPEIQDILVQEIKEHDVQNGGKFDFNSIQKLKYMDMVVSEGLRLYPAAGFLDRICVKDYNFGKVNKTSSKDLIGLRLYPAAGFLDRICVKDYNFGKVNKTSSKDLIVRKGDVIGFPIWTFHRDPELFPDPLNFDPERFSDENKHNIKSNSYMPFGLGPRNCIGSRFALCEIKVMLYQLLREMKVTTCEKTVIPAKLAGGFVTNMVNGGWARLETRQ